MLFEIMVLMIGLTLLAAGAELLVKGGASLARRLGLTPLVIGLTVVAFGTSTPEMMVSVGGALKGHGDIAVGNVVGSNIFNIGLILGLVALMAPMHIKLTLIKIDAPILIVVSVSTAWLCTFDIVPRVGGILLIMLLIIYTIFSVILSRKEVDADINQEFIDGIPKPLRFIWYDISLIAIGLALLLLGSPLLVKSSMTISRALGVSEAVIGLTIVAAGTSMPELATSIVAAIRRQPDMSVGNIIGSSIFNILGIFGLSAAVKPLSAPGISRLDLSVMVLYSIVLLPLLWTRRELQRWEGAVLLGGYIVYLWVLWPTA